MGGRGGGSSRASNAAPAAATGPNAAATVDQRIRDAYSELPKGPAGYVGLADLRDQLSDLPRADVDAALNRMSNEPGVHLTPVANRRSITQRDRDAALRIGEDDAMMFSIRTERG